MTYHTYQLENSSFVNTGHMGGLCMSWIKSYLSKKILWQFIQVGIHTTIHVPTNTYKAVHVLNNYRYND